MATDGIKQIVKALYDYEALQDGELSFKAGQVLLVHDRHADPNWWDATMIMHGDGSDSRKGRVPSNYMTSAQPIGIYRAVYEFEGGSGEELSVAEGQVVHVFEHVNQDWWLIGNDTNTKFGLIPSNYLAQVEQQQLGSPGLPSGGNQSPSLSPGGANTSPTYAMPGGPPYSSTAVQSGPYYSSTAIPPSMDTTEHGMTKSFSGKELMLLAAFQESNINSGEYVDPLKAYASNVKAQTAVSDDGEFDREFDAMSSKALSPISPRSSSSATPGGADMTSMNGGRAMKINPRPSNPQAPAPFSVPTEPMCQVAAIIKVGKKSRSKNGYLRFKDNRLQFLNEGDFELIQEWGVHEIQSYARDKKRLTLEFVGGSNEYEFQANKKEDLKAIAHQLDAANGIASQLGESMASLDSHDSPALDATTRVRDDTTSKVVSAPGPTGNNAVHIMPDMGMGGVAGKDTKAKTLRKRENLNVKNLKISSPLAGTVVKLSGTGELPDGRSLDHPIKARAKFTYAARGNDELSVTEGDVLVIVDKADPGWWRGCRVQNPGKFGLIPSNYVEVSGEEVLDRASPVSTMPPSIGMSITRTDPGPASAASVDSASGPMSPHPQAGSSLAPAKPQRTSRTPSIESQVSASSHRSDSSQPPAKPPRPRRQTTESPDGSKTATLDRAIGNSIPPPSLPARPQTSPQISSANDDPAPPALRPRPTMTTSSPPVTQSPVSEQRPQSPISQPMQSSSASQQPQLSASQQPTEGQRSRPTSASTTSSKTPAEGAILRTWVDRSGTFKVEGRFITLTNGKVQLLKANGVKIGVALDKLSAEDVDYVNKFVAQLAAGKSPSTAAESSSSTTKPSIVTKKESPFSLPLPGMTNGDVVLQPKNPSIKIQQPSTTSITAIPEVGESSTKSENYTYNSFNWYEFFTSCKVNDAYARKYAIRFVEECMDQDTLDGISRDLLKEMRVAEGDIIRILKRNGTMLSPTSPMSLEPSPVQPQPPVLPSRERLAAAKSKLSSPIDVSSWSSSFNSVPSTSSSGAPNTSGFNPMPSTNNGNPTLSTQQDTGPALLFTDPETQKRLREAEAEAQKKILSKLDSRPKMPLPAQQPQSSMQQQQSMTAVHDQIKKDGEFARELQEREVREANLSKRTDSLPNQKPPMATSSAFGDSRGSLAATIKILDNNSNSFPSGSSSLGPASISNSNGNLNFQSFGMFDAAASSSGPSQPGSNNNKSGFPAFATATTALGDDSVGSGRRRQQQAKQQGSAVDPSLLFNAASSSSVSTAPPSSFYPSTSTSSVTASLPPTSQRQLSTTSLAQNASSASPPAYSQPPASQQSSMLMNQWGQPVIMSNNSMNTASSSAGRPPQQQMSQPLIPQQQFQSSIPRQQQFQSPIPQKQISQPLMSQNQPTHSIIAPQSLFDAGNKSSSMNTKMGSQSTPALPANGPSSNNILNSGFMGSGASNSVGMFQPPSSMSTQGMAVSSNNGMPGSNNIGMINSNNGLGNNSGMMNGGPMQQNSFGANNWSSIPNSTNSLGQSSFGNPGMGGSNMQLAGNGNYGGNPQMQQPQQQQQLGMMNLNGGANGPGMMSHPSMMMGNQQQHPQQQQQSMMTYSSAAPTMNGGGGFNSIVPLQPMPASTTLAPLSSTSLMLTGPTLVNAGGQQSNDKYAALRDLPSMGGGGNFVGTNGGGGQSLFDPQPQQQQQFQQQQFMPGSQNNQFQSSSSNNNNWF